MAFIGDSFTFGFDHDFDEGVRAYDRGDDHAAAQSLRKSIGNATEPVQRDRAIGRLVAVLARAGQKANHSGDYTTARECFAEAVRLRPTYADLRIGASWAHFIAGDYKSASNEAQAALAINSKNSQARALMGLCLVGMGKVEEGFEAVKDGLSTWMAAPGSLLNTYEAWKSGARDAAITMARTVRPPAPMAIESQIVSADAAMKDRRWEVAESAYKAILSMKPYYADIWAKLGQCHLNLDDYERAADDFREAVTINPDYAQAWSLLGVALRRCGAEDSATEAFQKALAINKDEPVALHELARRR